MTSLRPGHRLAAEGLGTAALLAVVIGSGIMGEKLAGGNAAVALLANTLATAGGLYVLIECLGPVSGAHFNPAVSLVMAARGELGWRMLASYVPAQLAGAVAGAWLAHAMFDRQILEWSTRVRFGPGQWLAEGVATAGLVLVILRAPRSRASLMVAAYIGAAYWFTASTSFANPAAAFGRMLSDSFAGIAPASVPAFVVAELAGAFAGLGVHRMLGPAPPAAGRCAPVPGAGRTGRLKLPTGAGQDGPGMPSLLRYVVGLSPHEGRVAHPHPGSCLGRADLSAGHSSQFGAAVREGEGTRQGRSPRAPRAGHSRGCAARGTGGTGGAVEECARSPAGGGLEVHLRRPGRESELGVRLDAQCAA